ncbi:hypothetical protein BaRGS_00004521 [Batillaria attramentaria]|uniref:Uncharacterized protein n=1 Tax=Batillaria attramentaria TaxID=370345 RepID=A0ABD0LXT7_9CAEN
MNTHTVKRNTKDGHQIQNKEERSSKLNTGLMHPATITKLGKQLVKGNKKEKQVMQQPSVSILLNYMHSTRWWSPH